MRRNGHTVELINPDHYTPKGKLAARFHYETGGIFCEKQVAEAVLIELGSRRIDLTWVDNGRYVGPILIRALQQQGPVLNYHVDDPYGRRDRFSWQLYRKSVPIYDLVAVVREENVPEARALGARRALRVYRSADEVAHAPRELSPEDHTRWDSDVVFVGTWMPERGGFMAELVQSGIPLTLYGNRWQQAREWPLLRTCWKGPGTTNDDDYAKAIQCAKINLGLLSKGNRDLHTTRSLEIPCLGGLFCAERTVEHEFLYCEGKEAMFWSDAAECVRRCKELLADEPRRREIARRGRERCLKNGFLNQKVTAQVMSATLATRQ